MQNESRSFRLALILLYYAGLDEALPLIFTVSVHELSIQYTEFANLRQLSNTESGWLWKASSNNFFKLRMYDKAFFDL